MLHPRGLKRTLKPLKDPFEWPRKFVSARDTSENDARPAAQGHASALLVV